MIDFLTNLFQKENSSDNYTQDEREALLEIILLSTYIDNHLDLSEKKIIESEVKSLAWESVTPVENFISEKIGGIRNANNHESFKKEILTSIQKRLFSEESKKSAYAFCEKVLMADGTKTKTESDFQNTLKSYIGL